MTLLDVISALQATLAKQAYEISEKDKEIQRLRKMAIPDGMSYAETCLLRAKLNAAVKEIARQEADLTSANKFLRDQQERIRVLEAALLCGSSSGSRAKAIAQAQEGTDCGQAIRALKTEIAKRDKEIKHLQSAVGKRRGKADRLGKKIAAQNAEIHRLNELLRAIRQRYEGNGVKSFARMADPHDALNTNCRCWINPCADQPVAREPVWRQAFASPKELRSGDKVTINIEVDGPMKMSVTEVGLFGTLMGVPSAPVRAIERYFVYDERGIIPEREEYATMCPDCGRICGEGGCPECAANREAHQ